MEKYYDKQDLVREERSSDRQLSSQEMDNGSDSDDTGSEATLMDDGKGLEDRESCGRNRSCPNFSDVLKDVVEPERENYWHRRDERVKDIQGAHALSQVDEQAGGVKQVKELLSRLSPMISMSGTSENTPDILMFLSDTDPNFHTLQLVRSMRSSARSQLGDTIKRLAEEYVNNKQKSNTEENPIVSVLNSLFQEENFLSYMENFQNNLMASCDYLHQNFNTEATSVMLEYCLASNMMDGTGRPESSSNSSSLNSSLNQSGFLFLTPLQYDSIAATLMNKQATEKWPDCLNQLLAVTPGEPVIQDSWKDIKKGLQNCLHIPFLRSTSQFTEEIFDKSLMVHSKLLGSQTQSGSTEANLNLLECVFEFWYSKKLIKVVPKKSHVIELEQSTSLFKIIRLLLQFQMELPQLWIRYPEHLTFMLVEKWMDFLADKCENKDYLSCCDLISLLDPDASWMKCWLHGRYSRSKVINVLARSPALLKYHLKVADHFIANASSYEESPTKVSDSGESISESHLEQIKFLYSVNFLLELLKYRDGRQLFPNSLGKDDKKTTPEKLLGQLLGFLDNDSYSTTFIIRQILNEFCCANDGVIELICKAGLPQLYVGNLLRNRHKMGRKSLTLQLSTLNSVISNSGRGLLHVLIGDADNGITSLIPTAECDSLLKLFARLIVEEHETSSSYTQAFSMCVSLLNHPVGQYLYAQHQTFRQAFTNLTNLYDKK